MACHPFMAKDLVKSERSSRDDGLIQRFLLFAPKPVYIKKIQEIDEAKTECLLDVFFYIIKRRHDVNVTYKLSDNARDYFGELFMKNQVHNENFSEYDTFIRYRCFFNHKFQFFKLLFLL